MTPAGWRLVPVKPTQEMRGAAWGGMDREGLGRAVEEAIAAAPDPLQDEGLVDLAAQAICNKRHHGEPAWKYLATHQCDAYRAEARAVLALFRGEGR